MKRIKQSVEKSVSQAGGKALDIPIGNLLLLCDHPEGQNKIQDYESGLFIVESKHWDPNVYTIKPLNGKGPMCMVNQQQLFSLQKLQGDNLLDQAPDTTLPINLTKKGPDIKPPQSSHPYGTRSKTKVNSILLDSSSEDEECFGIESLIGSLIRKPKWL